MPRNLLSRTSRTKTVATVGPACSTVEKLTELILAGVDIFRLNMAHGDRVNHEAAITNIRLASEQTATPTGILVDLAGPKIRLGKLFGEPLRLKNGKEFTFVRGVESTAKKELVCLYEQLIDEVKVGDSVVLADGLARLEVIAKTEDTATCKVIDGGSVRSRQGVNLPGTNLSVPALGEKDKENAIWAAGQGADFVSLSFVRNAGEIIELKALLKEHGSPAVAIAKIEKREALDNLDEIVKASDGIMVARGDLGVEIAIEKTPLAQKRIIKTCLQHRKPVIVATQMLESMHTSTQPTRAEVSDVANAILDGADACMLSGETAIGEYPVEAAGMMQKIMLETEATLQGRSSRMRAHDSHTGWSISDAVIFGSAQIARRVSAKMVVIFSNTSEAAMLKSKQRDFIPTICINDDPVLVRRMCLYWGVVPVHVESIAETAWVRSHLDEWAKSVGECKTGDPVVFIVDTELMPGVHDNVLVTRIA